jgi:serine phosphatase RsbU (regulator of sigma subunit)
VIAQLGHHIHHVNQALGLFSDGFEALERDDLDLTILDDLNNPVEEVRDFAVAFKRLAHRIGAERRNRDEMASAALIQRSMLPEPLEAALLRGRATVFGDMKPAREVGGDLYDIFMLDDDHLAIAVGDVCGKGVPASLFMSVTITTLRLAVRGWKSLPKMLQSANELLCARNPTLMFTTLFFGVLDLNDGRLEYANCGHNPPVVLCREEGSQLLPSGGWPLGLAAERTIRTAEVNLGPGDGLFLFTDGVTECLDCDGVLYGDERLRATLERCAGLEAEPLVAAAMADVAAFAAGAEPFDDITCLAVVRSRATFGVSRA